MNDQLEHLYEMGKDEQAHFIRSVTKAVPCIILIVQHPSGVIEFNNRSTFEDFGFDVNEMLNVGWKERMHVYHPDDRQNLQEYYDRFDDLADDAENSLEYRVRNKNGEWVWMDVRGKVFERDEQGKVIRTLHTGLDITQRKRSEEEILQLKDEITQTATNKYLTIFNNMEQGFCIIEILFDDAGKAVDYLFLETNPRFEKQTGLQNAVGKRMKELQPDHEEHWFQIYGDVVKTGKPVHFEKKAAHLVGGAWYEVFALPFDKPEVRKVAVFFNDITDRKTTEERQAFLFKLNDALRPLVDPLEIQVAAADLLGEYLKVNQCHYAETIGDHVYIHHSYSNGLPPMVGKFRHEDFGKRLIEEDNAKILVCNETATDPSISEAERTMLLSAQLGAYAAIPLVKDGVWVSTLAVHSLKPRVWTQDELDMLHDVAERTWAAAERARAEATVRESERRLKELIIQKDDFIGIASHELKTPVTSMKGYAELVQEKLEDIGDKNNATLAQKLNEQIDRLTHLINNLLDTTKISEGGMSFNFSSVDLNAVLQEKIDEITSPGKHEIVLQTESLPLVSADRERIGQVVTNLLSNAVKYSPHGTTITVAASVTRTAVQVTVRDEGIGIPEADVKKVFDRFFRVTSSHRDTYPGMGLGLYISAGIIRRHRGTISVQSKPGEGTEFSFTIPINTEG